MDAKMNGASGEPEFQLVEIPGDKRNKAKPY